MMHLNAAEGWLGLDNVIEADKELKTNHAGHAPAIRKFWQFVTRWLQKAECWLKCEEVAEEIILLEPESTFGWIRRSFALHEQDLTATAREKLLPACGFISR